MRQAFAQHGGERYAGVLRQLIIPQRVAGQARGPLLDLGTGSGVLAIAAAKLGYEPVVAVDHEPQSVAASRENALVNGVTIDVRELDLLRDPLPLAHTVVANLLRPLLLALVGRVTEPPAVLIASGLLREQADEVAAAFESRHGLRERERVEIGDWAALLLTRAAVAVG